MNEPPNLLLSRQDGPAYPYSSLQVLSFALTVVSTALAIIACSLRMYSRSLTRSFGIDDWMICTATLFTINQCWSSSLVIHYEYIGVHAADIPVHDEAKALLYSWLAVVFYTPILSLVKTSILGFLLRLGGKQRRGVRIAIYTLITLNTLQIIAVLAVTIFQCTPVNLVWSTPSSAREGLRCINPGVLVLSVASWNILTDILVVALPYRIFFDIKTNKRMRNALIGVFMLGIVVTVFSIVRLYYMYRIFFTVSPDPTYSLGYILSAIESNLAIIASSIPALWPLARLWFPCMDSKLGINHHYQADIEVQTLGDGDAATAGVANPPKVKVTWVRANTTLTNTGIWGKSRESSMLAPTSAVSSTAAAAEGQGGDGLVLPPPSPSIHSREKHGGEEEVRDYFGSCDSAAQEPVCDSYHDMISTKGHVRPWSNAYEEALYREEHPEFGSGNTTACTLTPPSSTFMKA